MPEILPSAHMHWNLTHLLRRLMPEGGRSTSTIRSVDYASDFQAARQRSIHWGLLPPSFEAVPTRYASTTLRASINSILDPWLSRLTEDELTLHRFTVLAHAREILQGKLRLPIAYTIGYVQISGRSLCRTPIIGLEQMLRTGIAPNARICLHGWLTLPSYEIVDPTFWALLPQLSSSEERDAKLLLGHPDDLGERSYHPQWIGEGFVRRIGILKEYEGW